MKKSNQRKLRFEGLEDRRLAAGFTFQSTNLFNLLQQPTTQLVSSSSTQSSALTYSSFKPSTGLAPGIGLNHNETLICLPRRVMAE